jgi:Tfp pilus assembly protein PilE
MKKFSQAMLGVTLLEIMLVLAIAAMVIVMSIRYYQSASLNQKINTALQAITGEMAAGESVLAGTGSFTSVTDTNFTNFLPNGNDIPSPWGGGNITATTFSSTGYSISIPNVPPAACIQLNAVLGQNGKLKVPTTCTATADYVVGVLE